MRMPILYIGLSIVDLLAFIGFWSVTTIKDYAHVGVPLADSIGYWITALGGLYLAVRGFWQLTRSHGTLIYRPVVCVLLTMVPACGAMIGILMHLGAHPVGR